MKHDDQGRAVRYPLSDELVPSRATYLATAEARECDPLELPPLGETVDVDCLDALVGDSTGIDAFTCSFEYAGCSVTVSETEVEVTIH